MARHGFIAEVPGVGGESALVIYPGDMPDDGTAASALANHLARGRFRPARIRAAGSSVTPLQERAGWSECLAHS